MADVLSSFSRESLEGIYFHDHPEERNEKKKPSKKEIIDYISDKIDQYAIDVFVASLTLPQLKALAEKAKVEFKEGDNKSSKSVISRRLSEQIVSAGFDEFLASSVDAETLKLVAEDFDVKADKKAVAEAARTFAAERYFSSFDVEALRVLADDLKLENAAKSASKRKLVEAILAQEDAEKTAAPKKKKQKVDVGKKKDIAKGITFDEIFQHYYAEELRDYAKAKGIKVSGKKVSLIKRILAYLDGNTEGIMAGDKPEAKKKKASTSTKKSSAKKSSSESSSSSTSSKKGKKADTKEEKEEKDEENGNE